MSKKFDPYGPAHPGQQERLREFGLDPQHYSYHGARMAIMGFEQSHPRFLNAIKKGFVPGCRVRDNKRGMVGTLRAIYPAPVPDSHPNPKHNIGSRSFILSHGVTLSLRLDEPLHRSGKRIIRTALYRRHEILNGES